MRVRDEYSERGCGVCAVASVKIGREWMFPVDVGEVGELVLFCCDITGCFCTI
jgi:hypothetical protein